MPSQAVSGGDTLSSCMANDMAQGQVENPVDIDRNANLMGQKSLKHHIFRGGSCPEQQIHTSMTFSVINNTDWQY
jgi:hypothetical protein